MENYARDSKLCFADLGSIADVALKFADEKAPFCKVLIVTCQADIALSVEILRRLKRKGRKVTQIIIPNESRFSIKSVCGLFCVAEDVRLVIAIGNKAMPLADYFSTIKGLQMIAITNEYGDFFSKLKYIEKENGFERFLVDNQKNIIVCGQPDCEQIAAHFAIYKFKSFCYYAYAIFTGENFDRQAVFDLLYYTSDFEKNPENISSLEQANRLAGKFSDFDPLEIVDLAIDCSIGDKLLCAETVTQLLCSVFIDEKWLPVPDYNAISQKVSSLFGFNQTAVLKSLIERKKFLVKSQISDDFKLAIMQADEFLKKSIKRYIKPNDKNRALSEMQKNALQLAGCTPLAFNLLSACQEYPFK